MLARSKRANALTSETSTLVPGDQRSIRSHSLTASVTSALGWLENKHVKHDTCPFQWVVLILRSPWIQLVAPRCLSCSLSSFNSMHSVPSVMDVMLLFLLHTFLAPAIPGLSVPFAHPFPPWGNHESASPRSIQDWTKEGFEAPTSLPANLPSRFAQTEERLIDHRYMRWKV